MRRTTPLLCLLLTLIAITLGGCSNGTDGRCASLCEDDGVGDPCSADSISSCIASCEARISGVESLCATCLLEDARFGPSPAIELCMSDDTCASGQRCSGPVCSFCSDDAAERDRCDPPTEIECDVYYRDSVECAAVCVDA